MKGAKDLCLRDRLAIIYQLAIGVQCSDLAKYYGVPKGVIYSLGKRWKGRFMTQYGNKFKYFGTHDSATLKQMENACKPDYVDCGILCADGHLGYSVPIGAVLVYDSHISPSAVGYDIACGNKAVRLDVSGAEIVKHIDSIMNLVSQKISFGMGRKNYDRVDHPVFDDPAWDAPVVCDLKSMARDQLGTVGGGNHYVDIFIDEIGSVWCGVHFGSRGLGHKIATHFIKAAGGKDGIDAEPVVFSTESDLGQQYLQAMELAGKYAYAGRDWVCDQVARIIGAPIIESVHNHHNFAWQECRRSQTRWVVRKGATPCYPGQKGFVGGSMGDDSVILEGQSSTISFNAWFSTVHGAGRVMSRNQARGRIVRDSDGKRRREPGEISRDDMMRWIETRGVHLRGGDVDEAPQAYRRLSTVLTYHMPTIKILHTLRPIGVAMAGREDRDLYKD